MKNPSKAIGVAIGVFAGLSLTVGSANARSSFEDNDIAPFISGSGDKSRPSTFADELPKVQKPAVTPTTKSGTKAVSKVTPRTSNAWRPSYEEEEKVAAKEDEEEEEEDDADLSIEEKAEKQRAKLEKKIAEENALPTSDDPNYYYKRAQFFMGKKHYKQALLDINECMKLKPDYWEARYLGAYILQLQGRTNEAIDHYKKYVAVRQNDIQARINLGTLLRKAGDYPDAEEHYKKAIEINFYSFPAHYNLANVLIDQHKTEEALKELKACQKLQPRNAWVHNNLGVIYQKRNYLEEAEEEFVRALRLDPANKTFEQNLALLRQRKDKTKEMRADAADLL